MKKILLLLFLCVYWLTASASEFSKIIFFGDSLSDNGNLYKWFHIIPKSPPYYQGRFSNGPTWAEHLSKYYYDKYYISSEIYAVGGATALVHVPSTRFISPKILQTEIGEYLRDSLFKKKDKVLFVFWVGANDYLFDKSTNPKLVVDAMELAIKSLIVNGAKNFLVLNLPDLGRIPFAKDNPDTSPEILHNFAKQHNNFLTVRMARLKTKYPDVNFMYIDIYNLFNDVLNNVDKYNEKYHVHITNTTSACWEGKIWLQQSMNNSLQRDLTRLTDNDNELDIEAIKNVTLKSPELYYSYNLGKLYEAGLATPCPNANEYIYWDHMHPTEVVHRVLAQMIIEQITQSNFRASNKQAWLA